MRKLIALLTLLACTVHGFAAGQDRFSFSFSKEKVSLAEYFSAIEKQSDYLFVYADEVVRDYTAPAVKGPIGLEALLNVIFDGLPLKYEIIDKQICISAVRDKATSGKVQAPRLTYSGKIVDDAGAPVIGAVVYEKGSSNGVSTDNAGRFTIHVAEGKTLAVQSMGYLDTEIPAGRQHSNIQIVLHENKEQLQDVVIVGFATQKKINLTGSVATIDSKAFEAVPVQNAVQALQGKVPGLTITSNSGQLNERAGMSIRGLATIGEGSYANVLVLIDGMEGDLHSINPQDIEDISVLKDAAASSIYGSRAPFGVILVTTKSGRSGKTVVNYNNNFRWSSPINLPTESDSYTWATYFNDAARNGGASPWIADETLQRIRDYMDGKIPYNTIPLDSNPNVWNSGYDQANDNIDYYRVFYKTLTFEQEHNVSASGGNDKIAFYVSANFLKQEGKMNYGGDGLNRLNLSGKLDANLTRWARLSYHTRLTREYYFQPAAMNDDMFFTEIGRQSWPIGPLYDPNGYLFNDHVLRMVNGHLNSDATASAHQVQLRLNPLPGWEINADANYRLDYVFVHEDFFPARQMAVDGVSYANEWYRNYTHERPSKNEYYNVNAYTSYEKTFADAHYIKAMAGFQLEDSEYRYSRVTQNTLVTPEVISIDSATGLGVYGQTLIPAVGGDYTGWSTMGFFGRLNYNFKERYLLEANARYDGTSRFRRNNRWGFFPSVSVGWNIASEPFMKGTRKVLDVLKLRASYGSVGNQYTSSPYPTYANVGYQFNGGEWLINGAKPNVSWFPGLISSSLTWEEVRTMNFGLDWALFNKKLTGSLDIFERRTLNMVGPSDELPVVLGTSVPASNNTDLCTRGFEMEIQYRNALRNGLVYSARFVLSDAQGTITRYSNPSGTLSKNYAGKKWGEIWGYETVGMAKTQEEMDAHLATLPNGGQNTIGLDWGAGDMMYADLNGDGKVDSGAYTLEDHGDLRVIGNTTPRFNFGLDLSAEWKGFDLRIFLQGTAKRDYFQNTFYFWGAGQGVWWSMCLKEHEDYFRDNPDHPLGQNINSYYPRPVWGSDRNRQVQTRYLQDASYLRLKNLQFGYTLPEKVTSKAGISRLRLFFTGENLLTLTKMSTIFDPETVGTTMGSSYPLSRVFAFGINITI